jgi:hypothetical protein
MHRAQVSTVMAVSNRCFLRRSVETDLVLTMVFKLFIDMTRSLLSARSSQAETLPP